MTTPHVTQSFFKEYRSIIAYYLKKLECPIIRINVCKGDYWNFSLKSSCLFFPSLVFFLFKKSDEKTRVPGSLKNLESQEIQSKIREFRLSCNGSASLIGAIRESANNFSVPFSVIWISRNGDAIHSLAKASISKRKN